MLNKILIISLAILTIGNVETLNAQPSMTADHARVSCHNPRYGNSWSVYVSGNTQINHYARKCIYEGGAPRVTRY
ncbi:hypothetical protein N473_20265 [Pseudoalteromonas luteoviolacea CPMOR-1]|uniref:Uncharacterized protein n=3 Tax=Pseudoalteromonas luteoviolacea TaxID=43657 RepID=A0A167JZ54_9GAMM|nr:hypothetical protein JF50_13560 [Pseudoalteromonas luteoviolacea]KZN61879.1 hypothetical protein N473_20265 [Pseudoalteromonas luteoviolacea CPMOR-1]